MNKLILLLSFLLIQNFAFGQQNFTPIKDNSCTSVKSQDKTGTCWSFSTVSFLESELIRMGKASTDLSEMYAVRAIYMDKAQNFLFRQGKANFSQGSLSHDVIRAYDMVGILPESAYSGLVGDKEKHNHGRLETALKTYLKGLITKRSVPEDWRDRVNEILDEHLGAVPESFTHEGRTYTPETFTESLGLKTSDYVTLTSFTHHPFYSNFILEIPDNYSNGDYYNLPLEELVRATDNAVTEGYTVVWDGDVSEPFFLHNGGIAFSPKGDVKMDEATKNAIDSGKILEEVEVDQELRQKGFESFNTTDDHLMHIVGIAKDDKGNIFYKTKNSWGDSNLHKGYLYMSAAYFQLKTVAVMVHKDAIPADIRAKLGL